LRYTISRVRTASLAKFGFLLGTLAALLPGTLCGWTTLRLVTLLRSWLESWREVEIGAIGLTTTIDFVDLMGLAPFLASLKVIEGEWWAIFLTIVVLSLLVGGLLVGLTVLLLGWVYNLLALVTGGLEVELQVKKPGFF
jgi:hypothetical protein